MRLCLGLAIAILFTGGVFGLIREPTLKEGESYIFTVLTFTALDKCHLKNPSGDIFQFTPGDETQSTEKYVIGQGQPTARCEVTLKNADKNDEGTWEMYFTNAGIIGSTQFYTVTVDINDIPQAESSPGAIVDSDNEEEEVGGEDIKQSSEDNNKSEEHVAEEENITVLSEIIHYTREGNAIDISLNKESFNENCYIQPPNGEMVETPFFEMPDVTIHGKSEFVSCRITLDINNEDLLGEWRLCGKSEQDGAMRCQPVKIELFNVGTPSANWNVRNQLKVDHPVHFGGSVNPGVAFSLPILTCHVVTPHGEDLVLKPDVNYPHIVRTEVTNPFLCAAALDINSNMLGEWVIYGRFRHGNTQQEVRLPMSFYVYNTENPYEQAYNVTILAETNHGVSLGGHFVETVDGTGQIDDCVYVTPKNEIFSLNSEHDNQQVTLKSVETRVACRLIIYTVTDDMLGQWQLIVKSNDGKQFYETQRIFKLVEEIPIEIESHESDELSEETENENGDENMILLSEIYHFTRQEARIEITLNKETFEEECYIRTPGSSKSVRIDQMEKAGLTAQSKSNFVSCRVTIGPMTEELLGVWRLCGKSVVTGQMRCQPASIEWNRDNGIANWDTVTQPTARHPVHIGGSVNSGADGSGQIITCHVITPAGEDLVVSSDVKYPHIEYTETGLPLCSIVFRDITMEMLGDWVIIGRFRAPLGKNENRQPLNFFLYNEDNPYEQAYNVSRLPEIQHTVYLGGELTLEVSQTSGAVQDCMYRTPSGQTFDLSNYQDFLMEGVHFKHSDTGAVCQIVFSPVTENAIGNWQIIGKFNNGVLFDKIEQDFKVIQEDPSSPIEDEVDRDVEILPEQIISTEMYTTHRIFISSNIFIENESCHLVMPSGEQYTLKDGFNVPGVTIINEDNVECGVELNLTEQNMIGTWTIIAKATSLFRPIERRLPVIIRVEENFVIHNDINISKGADLHLHLNYGVLLPETCAIYGPDGEKYVDAELDGLYEAQCGFIVRNVDQHHTGKWIIEYGAYIKQRGSVNVYVSESAEISVDNLRWSVGDSIDVTVGPEDVVYCKLEDPYQHIVFDGFGQCRIVLDSVGLEHRGLWHMYVAVPGNVLLQTIGFDVSVQARDGNPVVTTAVERNAPSVMMSCTVPNDYEVKSCSFRSPQGDTLVAAHGVGQDGYMFNGSFVSNYESDTQSHDCTLHLLNPAVSDLGIWRCSMHTTTGTYHGFITVMCPHLLQNAEVAASIVTEPVLQTGKEVSFEENRPAVLSCSIPAELRYCYFRTRNGTVYNVFPSMSSSLPYEYVGAGLDAGECGIRFKNGLANSEGGMWSCHVGLVDTSVEEQRASFVVEVRAKMSVYHDWHSHALRVGAIIFYPYNAEYCRFVRIDGQGFTTDRLPEGYEMGVTDDAHCSIHIIHPTVLDLHPWTVAVKFRGLEGEVSMTTTDNLFVGMRNPNIFGEILFWSLIVLICLIPAMAASALIPKNNRDWTYRRASRIRTSFRSTWDRTFKKTPIIEQRPNYTGERV